MKNLVISTCIVLYSLPVHSQTVLQKPVVCDNLVTVMKAFTGPDVKEIVRWAGFSEQDKNIFILLSNSSTGTWTLIQSTKDIGCVLGTGEKSIFRDAENVKKISM